MAIAITATVVGVVVVAGLVGLGIWALVARQDGGAVAAAGAGGHAAAGKAGQDEKPLRIAHRHVGYLLNFGQRGELQWKRLIVSDLHPRGMVEKETGGNTNQH